MPTQRADIIREYLLKYPLHSKKAIGKLLYKEHPLLFNSDEYSRTLIRYYTGNAGIKQRNRKTAYYDELRK